MKQQETKKSYTGWIVIGVIVATILWISGGYNGMVSKQEKAQKQWGNVNGAYQRRNDLIPNVVAVAKGYAAHEQETLTAVIDARAKASALKIDPSDLTAEKLEEWKKTQGELSQALGRLMMIQERYPELKANEMFLSLQDQIEGSENRINVERNRFDEAVEPFNKAVRHLPGVIIARICGFKPMSYFEAEEGSEKAPKVEF